MKLEEPGTVVAIRPLLSRAVAAPRPPALIALGFAPLLALQARSLWDRPHLQGFPLAVAGGLALAWMATRSLGPLQPGSRALALAAAGLSAAALAVAGLAAWPWLGTVAAMAALLAAAYGLGGWRLLRAVLPAWAFVALAILPPNGGETWLVNRLQALATAWASPVLYALGVIHVTEGNVVRVPGRVLMVEQACSGVRSLLFVLGCTLFFAIRAGRRPVRAALLLAAAGAWVVLGNVLRIVVVAYLMARWGIDFSAGLRHEALGLAILALVLGLTVSSDRLIQALPALRWTPPEALRWRFIRFMIGKGNGPTPKKGERRAPPRPPAPVRPAPEDAAPRPTEWPELGTTWLGSWPVAAAFGLLGLAQTAWLGPALADAVAPDRVVERLRPLAEGTLPARQGEAIRAGFRYETRDTTSDFGAHGKVWRYQAPNGVVIVSVDYPFRGWHELTQCYRGIGWTPGDRALRRGDGGWFVEATFTQPDGRPATLLFGLDDQDGAAMQPRPFGGPLAYLRNRLRVFGTPAGEVGRRVAPGYEAMPRGYQVQLMLATDQPLSPEGRAEARRFFDEVRGRVRAGAKDAGRAPGPGGPS